MQTNQIITAFSSLGQYLRENEDSEALNLIISRAYAENRWFTPDNIRMALHHIAHNYLEEGKLRAWISRYDIKEHTPFTVGIVMAGNLPLVGWHDLMCVLMSGNKAQVKLSVKDQALPRFMMDKLTEIAPPLAPYIQIVDKLNQFNAVIATGSGNTARYFEYYFGKYPHIIRKNRTSVAVMNGKETTADFQRLGKDIFSYFGLGCRNISHLFVPQGFDFTHIFDALELYKDIAGHNKYFNNYEYYKSLLLLNKEPHLDNGFLIIKESKALESPVASLYYSYYANKEELNGEIDSQPDAIQCVVSKDAWLKGSMDFGEAQCPTLSQYADNVDTMEFLSGIKIY